MCSTLSFSGAGIFMHMNRGFDVVIIDEAAQAVRIISLFHIFISKFEFNIICCCV